MQKVNVEIKKKNVALCPVDTFLKTYLNALKKPVHSVPEKLLEVVTQLKLCCSGNRN